ncbi:MAG: TolC family protein, partial [Alphaproteobacteria bacterium]|nr:TolC family protein [Alphaproteobacteria bacterium]
MTRNSLLLLGILVLPACTVGPDYKRPPEVKASPDWIEATGSGSVDALWWTRLGNEHLNALIAQANANSPDVRVAQARLREARANRDAVAGTGLPRLNASGAATTNRVSENGQIPIANIPGFPRDFDLYDAGFDASWEIDLWGHAARQTEAASARAEAVEAEQRSVLVSLHAEIAQSYIDLRTAQALLASAKADALAQDQIAHLTRQRLDAGESSRSDYVRAESRARASAAQTPVLEADIRAAIDRIALLVGQPPEAMDDVLIGAAPIPTAPADIAMGLRSDMLRRRPDIMAAE